MNYNSQKQGTNLPTKILGDGAGKSPSQERISTSSSHTPRALLPTWARLNHLIFASALSPCFPSPSSILVWVRRG